MTRLTQAPPSDGVYLTKSGKLKVFEKEPDQWILDEGQWVKHPLFRASYPVVKNMSIGWDVFDSYSDLKDAEYLGEL